MEIKLTRPKEFNDPFEWSPAVSGKITAEDVATMYEDPHWVKHWDLRALESVNAEDRWTELQSLAAKFTEMSQELMEEQLDDISERWALLCLSANPGNILMWSHYAENHRGFAASSRACGSSSEFQHDPLPDPHPSTNLPCPSLHHEHGAAIRGYWDQIPEDTKFL